MTTPKVKPNALPVSFDQFRKNPIAAVAFCMLLAVSYRGKWFVIEVKTKTGKLREGQERFQQLNCAPVYVVRTSDEAIELLTNN